MSDISFWKPVYQFFKPEEPLIKEELRDFYVRRDNSPVDSLVNLLAMEDSAAKFLLAGHRGSGKTTELRRLEQRCMSEYTVVWVDTDTYLDKYDIEYADVVVLIGITIVQRLGKLGWKLPRKLEQDLLESLAKVTYQDKVTGGGQLQLPKLFQDLGGLLKVGFDRETKKTREVRPALSEIIAKVNAIIAAAEADKPKLLVIVDGLDRKDYGIALKMFSSSLLTDLNCHLVYVIPISLRYSPAFRQPMQSFDKCLDLTNIPVFKCDDNARPTTQPDPVGRHILTTVIEKRLQKLGDTYKNLFQPDALELLCEKSGGVMRDLVRLARTSCEVALQKNANQVDLTIAQEAIQEEHRTYSIEDYHFEELDKVHRTGKLTTNSFDSPKNGKVVICDELLHYKLILGYQDRKYGRWFDINPILLEDLERWRGTNPTNP
ncbi:MAG: AAA family ATPase [Symploca sp. SIO2E9]|nr:AAA family ATPase [Symploca sp. SIO2E9]